MDNINQHNRANQQSANQNPRQREREDNNPPPVRNVRPIVEEVAAEAIPIAVIRENILLRITNTDDVRALAEAHLSELRQDPINLNSR